MTTYNVRDAARILGVPAARLRYWDRIALVRPSHRVAARREFEFRDLVCIKRLLALLASGVSFGQIRASVEAIRDQLPELDRPLGALRVWLEGSRRVVVRHGGRLFEPSGQVVLDFTEPPAADGVAPIAPAGDPKHGADPDAALEWFECGLAVDAAPETYAQAIEFYQRAIEADPAFADAHCNLGAVYESQGRRTLARECFQRALALNPDHVEANFNMANVLEEDNRNEAALHHFKAAARADPFHSDVQLALALLCEKLGLRRKAVGHWRRYAQLEPAGAWSEIARQRIRDGG
ncbi:MAG: tetratricopeptide repeat protein [Deltaproteobacteria bacterium]|nr:MAG: tetratricopeptide repeat protein [Deltaproteobacteria bacterium]